MKSKIRITETELITMIQDVLIEQGEESGGIEGGGVEAGTSDAGGTGARQWESGLTRGAANPAGGGVTHWADTYTLTRGKANPLDENTDILKESRWYNTLLDVVGIVDPTPAADTINAISYFKQGDIMYAMLSLVSVVPYVGDFAAKPVIFAIKSGKSFKGMNAAAKTLDPTKLSKAANKAGPEAKKFVEAVGGGKVQQFLTKIVNGVGKWPFFKTFARDVKTYGKVFKEAAAISKAGGAVRIFRKGGILRNMQISPSGLLNRTKLYAKFISWLTGIGMGQAAIDGMSDGEMNNKFKQFLGSTEGENFFGGLNKQDQGEMVDAMQRA